MSMVPTRLIHVEFNRLGILHTVEALTQVSHDGICKSGEWPRLWRFREEGDWMMSLVVLELLK